MPLAPSAASPKVSGGVDPLLLARALRPVLAAALDQLGGMEVAEIQLSLATPYPPASVRGESPHRRTGTLQANVAHATPTNEETGLPELEITSSRPPVAAGDDPNAASVLEYELDRPYMRPALTRLETTAAAFLAAALGA